ncbi:hypothetical protein B0H19DRAFT_1374204 [Mycena capillaripes]|nr:hypothetical protein B0H19DRAFT_1374204 [Mycena capillaripes]
MTTILSPSDTLPYSQRLRLIRSIRKLGDLLTETSQLVEAPPPLPQHSRNNSMSSPVHNTTWSGSPPRTPGQMTSEESPSSRNFFSLHLPKLLSGDRTPFSSPLSPTFTLSLNSPSTPVVDPETLKERKLAKVVQTLGENVPPELVFPPPARKGRKRSSTVTVAEYTAADKRAVVAAGATVVGRRRHAREVSRTLKHAASSTSLRPPVHNTDLEPFSYSTFVPVPWSGAPVTSIEHTGTGMHRKEAGWSGEWSGSVQNMEDVVRGLLTGGLGYNTSQALKCLSIYLSDDGST